MKSKKQFTGDINLYHQVKNFLVGEGYSVDDAIHIGNNKFEFQESMNTSIPGCRNIHKILAWVENNKVIYKTKVIGFVCGD